MENNALGLEPLLKKAEDYAKTNFELYRLKTVSKTASISSTLASRALAIILVSTFISLLNIGIALWLGDLLGKLYYGFFCMAGLYALCGGIVYLFFHRFLKKRISNSIISSLLS
jgi:hypothetical protein